MTIINAICLLLKNNLRCSIVTLIAFSAISCSQSNENKPILKTKVVKSENLPTFLIYGELALFGYVEEKDSVSTKKFGFNVKRVADCDVTSELIDSVKTINIENDLTMKSKYGNDWKLKFEEQSKLKIAIPEI